MERVFPYIIMSHEEKKLAKCETDSRETFLKALSSSHQNSRKLHLITGLGRKLQTRDGDSFGKRIDSNRDLMDRSTKQLKSKGSITKNCHLHGFFCKSIMIFTLLQVADLSILIWVRDLYNLLRKKFLTDGRRSDHIGILYKARNSEKKWKKNWFRILFTMPRLVS